MDNAFKSIGMWFIVIIMSAILSSSSVRTIKVLDDRQVISIESGAVKGVILDCPYEVEGNDTNGLVVKWYLNKRHKPVYQWIVGKNAQDLGILKDRLDMSYRVSVDELLAYRALAIRNPTTELSANYTCVVSNFAGSDQRMKTLLTVYTPATYFNISITTDEEDEQLINVKCYADGIWPQPEMKLMKQEVGSSKMGVDGEVEIELTSENGYSIFLTKTFKIATLESSVDFICSLSIPNTDYLVERQISHISSGSEATRCFMSHVYYLTHLMLLAIFSYLLK